MPRPRQFETEDVVDSAMRVFWERGYQGTSLQNLVDATRVNRASLYSVFRDKRALFLAALGHYRRDVVPMRISILEDSPDGLQAIRSYFEAVADDLLGPARGIGCLMVNSAIELAAADPEVALEVARHLARLEAAFGAALGRAAELGELDHPSRLPGLARFLTAVSQGMMVIGKASPDPRALREMYEPALAGLS